MSKSSQLLSWGRKKSVARKWRWGARCQRSKPGSQHPALGQTSRQQQMDNCTLQVAQPAQLPRELQLCPGSCRQPELLTQPCCKTKPSIAWEERGSGARAAPPRRFHHNTAICTLVLPLLLLCPPNLQWPSIWLRWGSCQMRRLRLLAAEQTGRGAAWEPSCDCHACRSDHLCCDMHQHEEARSQQEADFWLPDCPTSPTCQNQQSGPVPSPVAVMSELRVPV